MQHKACELLLNDNAPEYFKAIGEKVCDKVDSLSFTEKSQTLKKYKTPALEDINKQRLKIQERILKKWIPECYRNSDHRTTVSNSLHDNFFLL